MFGNIYTPLYQIKCNVKPCTMVENNKAGVTKVGQEKHFSLIINSVWECSNRIVKLLLHKLTQKTKHRNSHTQSNSDPMFL